MASTFGKRGAQAVRSAARSGPILGPNDRIPRGSATGVVSQASRPTIHGSHFERHWPKYGASAFAAFAIVYYLVASPADVVTMVIATALAWFIGHGVLNRFRKAVNNVHTVRTQLFRSMPFLLGAGLGLGYYAFATFVSPTVIFGFPIGGDNFLADGFQQQDLASIAFIALGGAGWMVAGGMALEFIAKLFRNDDESQKGE